MKAVICTRYGPPEVLKIVDVPKPAPKNNEVLIKIFATTVHIGDTKVRRLEPGMGPFKDAIVKLVMRLLIGFRGPRKNILGMELAGKVESVGKNVTLFKKGDEVFAAANLINFGTYAEYICLPQNSAIALKPKNITFQQAAPLSNGGETALQILRKANVKKGQKVLIYGASGSVGTFAVQLAKYFGAKVTGVCSTKNLKLVKSLGADTVVDYTKTDFTKSKEKYDVIFDAVGKVDNLKTRDLLKSTGKYYNVLIASDSIILKAADLVFLKELVQKGKLKSVIDKVYSIDDIVEAHRYVDLGHKVGNVVIKITNS